VDPVVVTNYSQKPTASIFKAEAGKQPAHYTDTTVKTICISIAVKTSNLLWQHYTQVSLSKTTTDLHTGRMLHKTAHLDTFVLYSPIININTVTSRPFEVGILEPFNECLKPHSIVKLPFYLIKHLSMKAYEWRYRSTHFQLRHYVEVIVFRPVRHARRTRGWVGPRVGLEAAQ
jgi:hypothetical protein